MHDGECLCAEGAGRIGEEAAHRGGEGFGVGE